MFFIIKAGEKIKEDEEVESLGLMYLLIIVDTCIVQVI